MKDLFCCQNLLNLLWNIFVENWSIGNRGFLWSCNGHAEKLRVGLHIVLSVTRMRWSAASNALLRHFPNYSCNKILIWFCWRHWDARFNNNQCIRVSYIWLLCFHQFILFSFALAIVISVLVYNYWSYLWYNVCLACIEGFCMSATYVGGSPGHCHKVQASISKLKLFTTGCGFESWASREMALFFELWSTNSFKCCILFGCWQLATKYGTPCNAWCILIWFGCKHGCPCISLFAHWFCVHLVAQSAGLGLSLGHCNVVYLSKSEMLNCLGLSIEALLESGTVYLKVAIDMSVLALVICMLLCMRADTICQCMWEQ